MRPLHLQGRILEERWLIKGIVDQGKSMPKNWNVESIWYLLARASFMSIHDLCHEHPTLRRALCLV